MRVVVTGATGFIGRHLMAALPDGIAVGRSSKRLRAVFPNREIRVWNPLGDPDPSLFAGVEGVVHLAGESIFSGRWNAKRKQKIEQSRVMGTRWLVQSMARAEPRPAVLLSGSAVGYYGPQAQGDPPLTEKSPAGTDFLARVCQAWEGEARRAEDLGVRVVLLRTGVVFGVDGGALARMLPVFRLGLGGRLGNGRQFVPWIHIQDLVDGICHALLNSRITGPVNLAAPGPVTNTVLTQVLARILGRPALLPVPAPVLRLLLGEFASVLLGSQRVRPLALEKSGFTFRFSSIAPALSDLLDGPP